MTVGWKMQVEWKYGSMQWLDIKFLKALYPLDLADNKFTNNINKDL